MSKDLKSIVISNTSTINEAIDYMKSFCKTFAEGTTRSCSLTKLECIGYAIQLTQMAKLMDSIESIIKQTCQAILIADLDVEGKDIDECFEMYSNCVNRYETFREEAYNTILNEDYLKIAFKQNNNDEGEEKMLNNSENNKIYNSMEGGNVMKKYVVNYDSVENNAYAIMFAKEFVEELNGGCYDDYEDLSEALWEALEARLIYCDDRWDMMKAYQKPEESDYNEALNMCYDEIYRIIEEVEETNEDPESLLMNTVEY